jgi:hypothetical protein
MNDEWHSDGMYVLGGRTFVAQAFSLDDAEAIVREHNAHDVMLAACKAALSTMRRHDAWRMSETEIDAIGIVEAAIAKAEGGEE